jgi:hypothetical protein
LRNREWSDSMSTTITFSAGDDTAPGAAAFSRFVWKEIRMLRGLWLAVAILGVFVQWLVHLLTPPALDQVMPLFYIALGATILYAVGAASTTFSVEHEESTYDFLTGLPVAWWPLYAGKLIAVIGSSVVLAAALAVIGWMISDFDMPTGSNPSTALGLLGFAILEASAWGTLFSLLVKRPLVAAILTLVVGAVVVNLLVNLSPAYFAASVSPAAYTAAIPQRLCVAALVLACSTLLARHWLSTGIAAGSTRTPSVGIGPRLRAFAASRLYLTNSSARGERRSMLARLIWQTWCDSWKLLPMPIGVAAFLVFGIGALVGLSRLGYDATIAVLVSTLLFVPALYGAMAFAADQRRESYRFLAEHGARPRYVWLSRHIVWLGTLCILFAAVVFFAAMMIAIGLRISAVDAVERYVGQGPRAPEFDYAFERGTWVMLRTTTLAGWGILTAYSIGQFCSMLMRSEILAAFVALVLSVFLSAWLAVLLAWDLSGWLFLLPLAATLMLATWLRAPDWIAGRNSWQTWIRPALALILAFGIVGISLPIGRLGQIPNRSQFITEQAGDVTQSMVKFKADARETAEMYERAVTLLASWRSNTLLERWEKPEYMESDEMGTFGGIDETKIPPSELEDYYDARQKQTEQMLEAREAAIKLAIEASARPTCRFNFDVRLVSSVPTDARRHLWRLHAVPSYAELNGLLATLLSINSDAPFERLMAALRMSAHLAAGQPSVVVIDQIRMEQIILRQIYAWAAHESRTKEELQAALEQLTTHFRLSGSLIDPLYADETLVRDVLVGDAPPLVLAEAPYSLFEHLAYLVNRLPWERERGLAALNEITQQNTGDADQLVLQTLASNFPQERGNQIVRRWLRPLFARPWPEKWLMAQPAAATSYLTRLEYQARSPVHELFRSYCDMETYRRAALLQVALAIFRLDHGNYPERLSELIPDYLESLPMDPYSIQPFQYEPHGLDLPLWPLANYPDFQRIGANTPILWSVGAGNTRLEKADRVFWQPDESNPEGEPQEIRESVYQLVSSEVGWWGEPAFVFPLAK